MIVIAAASLLQVLHLLYLLLYPLLMAAQTAWDLLDKIMLWLVDLLDKIMFWLVDKSMATRRVLNKWAL